MQGEVPVYWTCPKVAKELKVSRNAVYAAYHRGSLRPSAFADERPLFSQEEVERYKRISWRRRLILA